MILQPKQRQIRYFLEIVRQGSIVGAAETLSITQPAVSRTLADLEALLDVRLLDRSRSGVSLTPAGELFFQYATASNYALIKGVSKVSQIRTKARRAIRVGMLPTVASSILPKAIRQFKQLRVEVPVHVATGTNRMLTDGLRQGDLDFVIGRLGSAEEMTGLAFDLLFQEEMIAVVRKDHPLLAKEHLDVSNEICNFTIILPLENTIVREDAEQLLISIGAGLPEDFIETLSSSFAQAYAEDSNAVWISTRGTVMRALDAGTLNVLDLDFSSTRGNIGITKRADIRMSKLAFELSTFLKRSVHS